MPMLNIPEGFDPAPEAAQDGGAEAAVRYRVKDGKLEIFEFEGFEIPGYEKEKPDAVEGEKSEKGFPMMLASFKRGSGMDEE